jgi:hypothetical protein
VTPATFPACQTRPQNHKSNNKKTETGTTNTMHHRTPPHSEPMTPPDNIQAMIEESLTGEPDDIWMVYQGSLPADLTAELVRREYFRFMTMLDTYFIQ